MILIDISSDTPAKTICEGRSDASDVLNDSYFLETISCTSLRRAIATIYFETVGLHGDVQACVCASALRTIDYETAQ